MRCCASSLRARYIGNLQHPDALRPDGSSTRRVMPLSEEIPNALEPGAARFWANVVGILESDSLRDSLFRRLVTGLRDRLGFDCTATVGHRRPRVGYPRCWLISDQPGFRIGIHPDVITKLVTLQFYLPAEDTHQGLGTSFYNADKSPSFTAPFRRNCGYAFVVTPTSWHGRETLPSRPLRRDTLAVTYFVGQAETYGK